MADTNPYDAIVAAMPPAAPVNPYDAVTISESDLTTELGLEYYFNRNAILFARYLHTNYTSTVPGSDYASDTIHVGLRVRQ